MQLRDQSNNINAFWAIALILLVTFAAFAPSLHNGFVNWDDPAYIQKNESIRSLSWTNIKTIFSSFVNSNYQPLTILSYAIEYHFAGLSPAVYHWTNLALHLINTVLSFWFILLLTKHRSTALIACLLFGIHPMRVESVAWITERKDVLFALFYLASLINYLFYRLKEAGAKNFLFMSYVLFLLSLLSKPTAMPLPLVLILIDVYLGRRDRSVILGIFPFFVTSVLFGLIALYGTFTPQVDHYPVVQALSLGVPGIDSSYTPQFHLLEHVLLCSYAVLSYLARLIWITGLSCYYPPPAKTAGMLPSIFYVSPIILLSVSGWLYWKLRAQRIALFGLGFFILTVAINLPLFDVGHASIVADRFTYIPYLGLFITVGELARPYILNKGKGKAVISLIIFSIITLLALHTWQRTQVWKNSEALWSDVLDQHPGSSLAYFNRGNYFLETRQTRRAIRDYSRAIALNPLHTGALNNRGHAYFVIGEYENEFTDFHRAAQINPSLREGYIRAYLARVKIDQQKNNISLLLENCARILRLDPAHAQALALQAKYNNLPRPD